MGNVLGGGLGSLYGLILFVLGVLALKWSSEIIEKWDEKESGILNPLSHVPFVFSYLIMFIGFFVLILSLLRTIIATGQ